MKDQASLKVLLVSAEVVPFAKSGGLADVAGSLPQALIDKGHDVRIAMPRYQEISQDMDYVTDFPLKMHWRKETCIVRGSEIDFESNGEAKKVPVYFIDSYHYFDRPGMYCHIDDAERFAFLCKAVLEMLPNLNFCPDVIHCNDWQSGPIAFLLKDQYRSNPFYRNIATLLTIHNLQYQGHYAKETLKVLGIDESYFTPEQFEFYGRFNFMKSGILYSDIINTVSEAYAEEILTSKYGEGLEGVLQNRAEDLYGIVNGIDSQYFNPKFDRMIYKNYGIAHIEVKRENKQALQREVGLPVKDVPVLGLIHRLVSQKGLELIEEISEQMMGCDLQFIILGLGDPFYEDMFKNMQAKYPDKVATFIEFNEPLAHKIYAGCDMFLMPSAFEPCGLGQLISLSYGTIPIVRATGGLKDTIIDFDAETKEGNGFMFEKYKAKALLKTIERALEVYHKKPAAWTQLVKSAMKADFSWYKQADKYLQLYHKAVRKTQ